MIFTGLQTKNSAMVVAGLAVVGLFVTLIAIWYPPLTIVAVTIPFLVAIVNWPVIGLYLLALTVPWEDVLYAQVGGFRWKPYEGVLVALLIALVLRQRRLPRDPMIFGLLLYSGSGILSLVNSVSIFDSSMTIFFEFVMVSIVIVLRWTRIDLSSLSRLTLFYVLVVGNLIGGYAAFQFIGYYLGFDIPYFAPELYAIFRPYGTFSEPNPCGNFLVSHVLMASVLALSPSFRRYRLWLWITASFQFALLILNLSRAPWVGLVVSLAAYALLYSKKHRRLGRPILLSVGVSISVLFLMIVLFFTSSTGVSTVMERFGQTINPLSEGTARERLGDMQLSLQLWRTHPWIGSGVGTWGMVAYKSQGRGARMPPRNIFLSWLFEKGVFGTLIAIGLYLWIGMRALRTYLRSRSELQSTLVLSGFLATLAVFVTFQFTRIDITPFYWFQMGLLLLGIHAYAHRH